MALLALYIFGATGRTRTMRHGYIAAPAAAQPCVQVALRKQPVHACGGGSNGIAGGEGVGVWTTRVNPRCVPTTVACGVGTHLGWGRVCRGR